MDTHGERKVAKHSQDVYSGDYVYTDFKTSHEALYITVPEGMTVTMFKSPDFTGESMALTGPTQLEVPSVSWEWSAQVREAITMD